MTATQSLVQNVSGIWLDSQLLRDRAANSMRRFLILIFTVGLLAACNDAPVSIGEPDAVVEPTPVPAPTETAAPQPTPVPTLQPTPTPTPSIPDVIERAQTYVVRIDHKDGCASGVLLGQDGLVLTNYHVIRGAESLIATTADGTTATLKVLIYDRERDLALLRTTSTLPDPEPIPRADDAGIGLGESILVLGFPFPGSLSLNDCSESITVTRGILSGRLDILGQAMLQTDAPQPRRQRRSGGDRFRGRRRAGRLWTGSRRCRERGIPDSRERN